MLRLTVVDMLFTGDGEAFNVRSKLADSVRLEIDSSSRSDNSSKMYRRTRGQVWALDFA